MIQILSRIFSSLRRRPARARSDSAPLAEDARNQPYSHTLSVADADALQRMVLTSVFSSLYRLCGKIERGYDAGKCMYDNGMISLAEDLTNSTGEIRQLIEQHARMQAVLVALHDGYDHFEVTGLECDDEYQVLKRSAAAMASEAKAEVAHA